MVRKFFKLTIALTLAGCAHYNATKLNSTLTAVRVNETNFNAQMPIDIRLGLCIIPVEINGKTYRFLFDTGSLNVISDELHSKLQITPAFHQKVTDSQNNIQELAFVKLPELSLGGINFYDITLAVADLTNSSMLKCLNIDGIIGSNLMKFFIWEINLSDQIIKFSDINDPSVHGENEVQIPIHSNHMGTPRITIDYNNISDSTVILDTGSRGGIYISKQFLDHISHNKKHTPVSLILGKSSLGIFGVGEPDSSHILLLDTMKINNLMVSNQYVIYDGGESTIGMEYLSQYNIVINWPANMMFMTPRTAQNNSITVNFGFTLDLKDSELFIKQVYVDSDAHTQHIEAGDKVLEIGSVNYRNCSQEQFCDFMEKGILPTNGTELRILLHQHGQEKEVYLKPCFLIQ